MTKKLLKGYVRLYQWEWKELVGYSKWENVPMYEYKNSGYRREIPSKEIIHYAVLVVPEVEVGTYLNEFQGDNYTSEAAIQLQ